MLVHLALTTALAALEESPLSRKKAMLLALLIDAQIDRRMTGDALTYRSNLSYRSPPLGFVMELAAMREGGVQLVLEPVTISAEEAATLREADYMVSLYNKATVQRIRFAWKDGRREDALTVLRAAVAALERPAA